MTGVSKYLDRVASGGLSARRVIAIAVGMIGLVIATEHAAAPFAVTAGYILLALALMSVDGLWLVVLPIAIVLGNGYPWTGSLLFTELDLVLLCILATNLWLANGSVFELQQDACHLSGIDNDQDTVDRSKLKLGAASILLSGRDTVHGTESRSTLVIGGLLIAAILIGAVRGWNILPLFSIDDQFSFYNSRSNLLSEAKGYLLILSLVPFLVDAGLRGNRTWQKLAFGVQLSALIVSLAVVLERWLTVGLFDFTQELRAAGPFFSMHIGGQHIDAYWGFSIPFLMANLGRGIAYRSFRMTLILLSLYAIFATMSRGIIAFAAFSLVALPLCIAAIQGVRLEVGKATIPHAVGNDTLTKLISNHKQWWLITLCLSLARQASVIARRVRYKYASMAIVVGTCCVLLWINGNVVRRRFESTAKDWQVRVDHWQAILKRTPRSLTTILLGNGLGTYSQVYRQSQNRVLLPVGLGRDNEVRYVRVFRQDKIFVEQWIDTTHPFPWTINASVRSSKGTGGFVSLLICKKSLLQSFDCQTLMLATRGTSDVWTNVVQTVESLDFSTRRSLQPHGRNYCPTVIAIGVGDGGEWVDIAKLSVSDAAGSPVVVNGDFARGSRRWCFTSDDHLVWRAENLWVHLYVELGIFGIMGFGLAIFSVAFPLVRVVAQFGDSTALIMAWSILGFLAMGIFGTLVDTPWVTTELFSMLAFGYGIAWKTRASSKLSFGVN